VLDLPFIKSIGIIVVRAIQLMNQLNRGRPNP
jgi:hypothetical protein